MHAASLLRAAAELLPQCRFFGLTGPRMRAAGCETIDDLSAHAAMLSGAIGVVGRAWRAMRRAEAEWRREPPATAVLLDSPELHLPLAVRAKRLGIPVLYYIAPQTWASREYRNRRIAVQVDRLACILPFEEAYFRARGVAAEYVGHPLFEQLARETPRADIVAALRSDEARPLIALLPGSRLHVIKTMLAPMLEVIRLLRAAGVNPRVAISAVDERRAAQIAECASRAGDTEPASIVVADNASLLTAADLVLVASGTATLHVAAYRKPMIVMYDAGTLMAVGNRLIGRWVVKLPHLSLVNILADRRIVPEFMPEIRDLDDVAGVACELLRDEAWRRIMVEEINRVVSPLESSRASRNVCRILGELVR